MNFVDQITRFAMYKPDNPALINNRRTLSYRQFYAAMTWAEERILQAGLGPGDRVGLLFRDDMGLLIAILACGRIGVTAMPLEARSSAQEVRVHSDVAALTRIVVDRAATTEYALPVIAFASDWLDRADWQESDADFGPARAQGGDRIFLITLSSGTTGRPVPSLRTHRHFSLLIASFVSNFGRPIGWRYLCMTSFDFSASRNFCLYGLMGGGVVHLHPPLFRPEDLVAEMQRLRIDAAFMVPTVIRWLLALEPPEGGLLLPDIKSLVITGAMMSAREKRETVRRITPNLFEIYGTTVKTITFLLPHEIEKKADSVGRPGSDPEVYIVDERGKPLGAGEIGRVRCAVPRWPPHASIESDTPADQPQPPHGFAWYYPGEVGFFDNDRYLHVKGRISDLIVRAGANVYPVEIEDVLMSHPGVVEAAVVGEADPVLGESVVAFVIVNQPVTAVDLRKYCRDRLVAYKVPGEIILVDDLPRTSGGKVRKNELTKRRAKSDGNAGA